MSAIINDFFTQEPLLRNLFSVCKDELGALQIWLFGSRARGDNEADSDWDVMIVLPDDAPEENLDCEKLWKLGRRSGVLTDLIAVKVSDFEGSKDVGSSLCYQVVREGVRLDG